MNTIKRKDYLFIRWCSGLLGVFLIFWAVYSAFISGLTSLSQFIYSFLAFCTGCVLLLGIGLNLAGPFAPIGFWDSYKIEE